MNRHKYDILCAACWILLIVITSLLDTCSSFYVSARALYVFKARACFVSLLISAWFLSMPLYSMADSKLSWWAAHRCRHHHAWFWCLLVGEGETASKARVDTGSNRTNYIVVLIMKSSLSTHSFCVTIVFCNLTDKHLIPVLISGIVYEQNVLGVSMGDVLRLHRPRQNRLKLAGFVEKSRAIIFLSGRIFPSCLPRSA